MPGLLVKVPIVIEDKIKVETIPVISVTMRMQDELPAPRDGIIKKINGKEGE